MTPAHGGSTFSSELDGPRLSTQHFKVLTAMYDGQWRDLLEIARKAGLSAASLPGISARLRDFRKLEHGGHTVERRRVAGGLWQYRLLIRQTPVQAELFAAQEATT